MKRDYIFKGIKVSATIFIVLLLLTQGLLITQENQETLNEIAARLNNLQTKVDKIQIRHSPIYRIQQWVAGKLK